MAEAVNDPYARAMMSTFSACVGNMTSIDYTQYARIWSLLRTRTIVSAKPGEFWVQPKILCGDRDLRNAVLQLAALCGGRSTPGHHPVTGREDGLRFEITQSGNSGVWSALNQMMIAAGVFNRHPASGHWIRSGMAPHRLPQMHDCIDAVTLPDPTLLLSPRADFLIASLDEMDPGTESTLRAYFTRSFGQGDLREGVTHPITGSKNTLGVNIPPGSYQLETLPSHFRAVGTEEDGKWVFKNWVNPQTGQSLLSAINAKIAPHVEMTRDPQQGDLVRIPLHLLDAVGGSYLYKLMMDHVGGLQINRDACRLNLDDQVLTLKSIPVQEGSNLIKRFEMLQGQEGMGTLLSGARQTDMPRTFFAQRPHMPG